MTRPRLPQRALAGLALAALAVPPAEAAEPRCRLALVLALDVSASIDAEEYALLRAGTAAALASPDVRAAIAALGGVHVAVFEWSGRAQQSVIAPWRPLDSDAAIGRLAARIAAHPRTTSEYPTALGAALGFANALLAEGPSPCERRVIDVAGDGENNHGFGPASAYRAYDFAGVTVNGLVVSGAEGEAVAYYREQVLHGPAAFLEVAEGYEAFERAMRRKLLREIGALSVAADEPRPPELRPPEPR
ncbi:MAG: DUF1194 domain-containing protein [Paracoccaceae bacterium]